MHPDVPQLLNLQRLDDHIAALKDEIARLPKHIADIEAKLASHQARLQADRASLEENKKSRRQLETSIEDFQRKISRLQEQMSEARTNEQYRAFQHEIDYQKQQISKAEDQILDKMEEAEALQENIRTAEASLRVETEKVAREVTATKARVAEDEKDLLVEIERRNKQGEEVDASSLRLYQTTRRKRGGVAVAHAESERCMACNVMLRPQFSSELRHGGEMLTCESCGRILYYESPGEGVEDPFHEKSQLPG